MTGSLSVSIELSKYRLVKEQLVGSFPLIDEETLRDTLEGITDLHEMIAAVIRSALVDEALHAGLRLRVDDMRERLSRLELRASKKRELALRGHDRGGALQARAARLYRLSQSGIPSTHRHRRRDDPGSLLAAAAAEARSARRSSESSSAASRSLGRR